MNSRILWLIAKKIVNTFWLAILLFIIMILGAFSQEILASLITSENANLYDTVFNGEICFCNIDFSHINFWFIIPSIAIVYIGMMAKTAKRIMILMSFLIFLTLTGSDIFFYHTDKLSISIISNFLGSPVIAGILILSLELANFLIEYFEIRNSFFQKLAKIFVGIFVGLFLILVAYIVHKNIYTLTTSNVDFTIKIPVHGNYEVDKKSNQHFGLFSNTNQTIQNKTDDISWSGFSKSFLLDWKKNVTNNTYKAEIRVIDECDENYKESINKILLKTPTYSIENINKIKLIVNDGGYHMSVLPVFGTNGIISVVADNEKIPFIISKSNKKGYIISRKISPLTTLKHTRWENKATYYIGLPNFNESNSKIKVINRNIDLDIGDEKIKINLVAKNVNPDKKMECKGLQKSKNDVYSLNSLFGGIVLTIQELNQSKTLSSLLSVDNEETLIKGVGGFIRANDVSNRDIRKYIQTGELKSLYLKAPLQELFIDDNECKVRQAPSSIQVNEGNLSGEITENGLIRFTGSSKAIYINEKRANLSRWEKVDIVYKMALGASLMGIIFFLFKRLYFVLTQNKLYEL